MNTSKPDTSIKPFKIHINLESLAQAKTGNITGQIWVQVGEEVFPEAGWYDFPLLFVDCLERADYEEMGVPGDDTTVSFFDGPFEINFRQSSIDDRLLVILTDRGAGKNSRSQIISRSQLQDELKSAHTLLVREVGLRGFRDGIIKRLQNKSPYEQ